jgi:hypothetical protein
MSDLNQKSLEHIPIRELSKTFDKTKEDDLIFRCSLNQLSKHFLKEYLPVNPFLVKLTK